MAPSRAERKTRLSDFSLLLLREKKEEEEEWDDDEEKEDEDAGVENLNTPQGAYYPRHFYLKRMVPGTGLFSVRVCFSSRAERGRRLAGKRGAEGHRGPGG